MKWLSVSNRPSRSVSKHFNSIDWAFGVFFALLCGAGPLIKEGGPGVILAAVVVCLFYVVVWRGWINVPAMWLFSFYGILYIVLSYFDIFPDAWTIYFDHSSILRQGYYIIALAPVLSACYILWRRAIYYSKTVYLASVVFVIVIAASIGIYLTGRADEGITGQVVFIGLINNGLISVLMAGLLALNANSMRNRFFFQLYFLL